MLSHHYEAFELQVTFSLKNALIPNPYFALKFHLQPFTRTEKDRSSYNLNILYEPLFMTLT